VWVLLEHHGPWAAEALESPDLPPVLRAHLAAFLEAVPGSRLQLIRPPDPAGDEPIRLFLVNVDRDDPWVLEWRLRDPAEALGVDLVASLAEGAHPSAFRRSAPLHLVCTHGRRDRCCALHGVPLSRSLAAFAPDEVFQASHVGGHRFAPNVLSFPEGVCYGRLELDEAEALVTAHREGRLHRLDRLRGRMRYAPAVQAAEIFLRTRLSDDRGGAPAAATVQGEAGDELVVRMELGGTAHEVRVRRLPPGPLRPASCGEPPTPSGGFAPA